MMHYDTFIIFLFLFVSVILNVYFFRCMRKMSKGARTEKDLRLLSDLMTNGHTLIQIKRIAPEEYFVRSPRDMI